MQLTPREVEKLMVYTLSDVAFRRKARYRGLEKNTAQLFSLFGLANLMLAKRYLQRAVG